MLISLDISTSCIGYSLFTNLGETVEINYVKFPTKLKLTIFGKLKYFIESTKYFENLSEKIDIIAIEEPLKKFKGKFSSADVIALLNFFNGMISSYLHTKYGIEPIYFNASHARKVVFPDVKLPRENKKYAIWEAVMKREPKTNWQYSEPKGMKPRKLKDENFDAADAYVIGRCMIELLENQKNGIAMTSEVDNDNDDE